MVCSHVERELDSSRVPTLGSTGSGATSPSPWIPTCQRGVLPRQISDPPTARLFYFTVHDCVNPAVGAHRVVGVES